MAKIQGIDMAFIKSISGVENTQRWEVTYECDFTVGSLDYDFRVDGTGPYAITGSVGDAEWFSYAGPASSTANNANWSDKMEFNSSGLQITPTATTAYNNGTDWSGFTNAPKVIAPLEDVIPGYDDDDIICIQLYADCSRALASGDQYPFFGLYMGLRAQTDSQNRFARICATWSGALYAQAIRGDGAQYESVGTQPDYFEIIIYPGLATTRVAAGTWDGDWPTPGLAQTISAYTTNWHACGTMTPSNTYVGLAASLVGNNVAGLPTFTSTAKKIRVSKSLATARATKGVSDCNFDD